LAVNWLKAQPQPGRRRGRFAAILAALALSPVAADTALAGTAGSTRLEVQVGDGPTESQIRLVLADAWRDATLTWARVLGTRAYENDLPQINFVPDIRPSHCYGLYVGAGPVYCSGNNTVFVSLPAMRKLSARIDSKNFNGLAILVAHEFGHHVQKVTGRFRVLSAMVRSEPRMIRELSLKFELEADCLAGVWARRSDGYASRPDVRSALLKALDGIGDDRVHMAERGQIDPTTFTHGTSEQRTKWFNTGYDSGERAACSVLESDDF
jgi:predicted metalloprotease